MFFSYFTLSQSLLYTLILILVAFLLAYFTFYKIPLITTLVIFVTIFISFNMLIYPHIIIKKHQDGFNRQITQTNNPSKQIIIDYQINMIKDIIGVDIYSQSKKCIYDTYNKKTTSNFLKSTNNYFLRKKYTEINECSKFIKTQKLSCRGLTISKCFDYIYREFYY